MASKIKGITIQIGGDTTGLDKALKGVNAEVRKTQDELREVEKALKLDPKNVDLLEQKQRALAKSIEATSNKLKELKKAQEQAAEQLAQGKIGQEQYDALTREIVKTEAALRDAKQASLEFNTGLLQLSESTRALSAAAGGAIVALGGLAVKAADTADELMTMSQQSGISTDELQRMKYAADLVDVSLESMVSAHAKLTKSMAGSTEAFDKIGVRVQMTNGQMRDSNEVFYETLTALSRVRNETERDQLAMQIFGKSANELAGIIDDGGAALRQYGQEAEQLGLVMDETTLQSLNAFNDQLDRLKAQATAELLKAGAAALEGLTPLIEVLVGVLRTVLEIIGSIDPGLISVFGTVALGLTLISPIAGILGKIVTVIAGPGGLVAVIPKLVTLLGTTQGKIQAIAVIASLLIGLIVSIVGAWDDMSGWEKAISVLGALVIAATGAAIALGAVQSAATMGIAAAAIVAGIVAITAAVNSATKRANQTSAASSIASSGSYAMTSAGNRGYGGTTTNNYSTNTYYQTSTQPMNVNLNLDGQTLARQMVTPNRAAEAAAGASNMN